MTNDEIGPYLTTLAMLAAAPICLAMSLRSGRNQRLVDNLPTSKSTGVLNGLVELRGTVEVQRPLASYLTGAECVWHRWEVEEAWSRTVTESYRDSAGNSRTRTRTESGWTTVAEGGESQPFYLRDDCGVIRIRPAGAEVEAETLLAVTCEPTDPLYYEKGPQDAVSHSDQRRRFSEFALPLNAPVFVLGQARECSDVAAAEIAADSRAPLFLISTRTEQQIREGYRSSLMWLGLLGLGCCIGGLSLLEIMLNNDSGGVLTWYSLGGVSYALAWMIGWLHMVYGSLADLRHRVQEGWTSVEGQLKRRHDLLSNLFALVTGFRDYERTVQTELAALRAQWNSTPPGEPGPDPVGCIPSVRALVKSHPELAESGAFRSLERQLVDAEQRIALAGAYYNEIAARYNARLKSVPVRFIAVPGRLKPLELLAADGFERLLLPLDGAAVSSPRGSAPAAPNASSHVSESDLESPIGRKIAHGSPRGRRRRARPRRGRPGPRRAAPISSPALGTPAGRTGPA